MSWINKRRRAASSEGGFTLIELMVGTSISLIVFIALYTFIDVASSNSGRVTARVEANKLARPVMADVMDKLHSACVAPAVAPILAGSTADSMSFVHYTGSAVSPTPVKRTIAYSTSSGGRLTESVYPVSSGTAPVWTFSSTALTPGTRVLLTPVTRATIGGVANTPVFRYYGFASNGQISTTPLATPLSAANAAKAVQVTLSFAVPPRNTGNDDLEEGTLSLTDSAIFRFTPPGESASSENLPCS